MVYLSKIQRDFIKLAKIKITIRQLGKTGLSVFPFGLGGVGLLEPEDKDREAVELIRRAYELGVNYFDTAPIYGASRERLGKALQPFRKDIILASKVHDRSYTGAKRELDESFKLLKTDVIDILQIHSVEKNEDLKALTKNGALRVMLEAKKAGKVRFIGVTGHYSPLILDKFLDEFDFDTVLFPINPAVPQFQVIIDRCRKEGKGIIAMKVMAGGLLAKEVSPPTLVGYSLPRCDVMIVGCSKMRDLEDNVRSVLKFRNSKPVSVELTEQQIKDGSFFTRDNSRWPSGYQPNFPRIEFADEVKNKQAPYRVPAIPTREWRAEISRSF